MTELFPPRPGGMVDTARQQAQAAQQHAALPLAEEDPGAYAAVRVRDEAADLGVSRTWLLSSANQVAQILPRDERRRLAVILAVDNDIYLATQEGAAQDNAGTSTGAGSGLFYLPAGIAVPVTDTAPRWAACTTTADISRVSVMISRDSD